MGEAGCFVQTLSYASGVGLPCDQHNHLEGNPMNALTQSISFGRFVSESASSSWDRWSVFPSNRYVEEAEKFSRPGSVAQKKAFFEAHYKDMAAKKAARVAAAAALLEQAKAPASTDPVRSDREFRAVDDSSNKNGFPADNLNNSNGDGAVHESGDYNRGEPLHLIPEVDANRSYAKIEKRESKSPGKSETSHIDQEGSVFDMVVEEKIFTENNVDQELHLIPEVDTNRSYAEIEKRESESPGKSETSHIDQEDSVTDMVVEKKIFTENNVDEELVNPFTASDHCDKAVDAELSRSPEMEKPLLQDSVREEVPEDKCQKKLAVACSKITRTRKASSGVKASPAMAASTPRPYRKGNDIITPISRSSTADRSDIKLPTPKRLPLGSLMPVREISKVTVYRRIGNQKTFGGPMRDCPTPSKTPTVLHSLQASANASLKYTLVTPKSESKRTPIGDGRRTGPKRRSLAKECSKFLSACKNKLPSPSLSTPFRLRTEERAARRKAKLEEKFDADEREKIQLQNLLKEREEVEVKKFRQTLCFKARPLPKFYRESTAVKIPAKKVESNTFDSSKCNRKLWSSTTMPRGRVLPQQLQGKKPVLDISLRNNHPARENRSPNVH